MNRRAGATAAIVGVVWFFVTWVVLSALRDRYSPVNDAISQLAELGAPYRAWMTAGIVAFGLGALAFSVVLSGRAGMALALAGAASLGVAIFPCTEGCPGAGEFTDTAHTIVAGIHYVSFLAAPLLLSRDRRTLAIAGVAAVALGLHGIGVPPNGALQRTGLTILDAWLVAAAIGVLRGRV